MTLLRGVKSTTIRALAIGVAIMASQVAMAGACPVGGVVASGNCATRVSGHCQNLYIVVGTGDDQVGNWCANGKPVPGPGGGSPLYQCKNTSSTCTLPKPPKPESKANAA